MRFPTLPFFACILKVVIADVFLSVPQDEEEASNCGARQLRRYPGNVPDRSHGEKFRISEDKKFHKFKKAILFINEIASC